MRTAICFNGLVGSTHGKSHDLQGDFKKCFEISSPLYREHIIDKNDTDVFVHSWSTVLENEIINTYKPKKHLIEPQIIFDIPTYVGGDDNRTQSHYSRWCSAKKVIDLKNEYEKENNFKYDCVMLARFDLAWQSDLIFDEHDHKYLTTRNPADFSYFHAPPEERINKDFYKNAKAILSHAITHLQCGKALKLIDTMMMTVMPLLKKYPKFSITANHISI